MLPALLLLFALQDKPPDLASISGVAADAATGLPLSKVQILAEVTEGRSAPASTVTDSNGAFTLVNLPAGDYRLRGARNGYLTTYYGARTPDGKGIVLSLSAGETQKALKLALFPFAVIAGAVRDPDGEPITGARVTLVAERWRYGVRHLSGTGLSATTDDLGHYRIPNVRPGRYYVHAGLEPSDWKVPVDHSPSSAPPPEALTPTYYPASREFSGARRIEVSSGDRFTGADVTLIRSRLFHVRVHLEGSAQLQVGVGFHPRPELSDGIGPNPPSDCNHGVCEFAAVPSGAYYAIGSASVKNATMDDFFSGNGEYSVYVPVDVASADVNDVRVIIRPPTQVAGRVTLPEGVRAPSEAARIHFISDEHESFAKVLLDGSFTTNLSPGLYEVWVASADGLFPVSIRSGQTDVLADGLTVSDSGKLPLDILLSRDSASLDGDVKDADSKIVSGATVVLAPKLRSRHDLYQQTSTDQFGRFRFGSVPPGGYELYAWPEVEDGLWYDSEFLKPLASQAKSVQLDPDAHESATSSVIVPGK